MGIFRYISELINSRSNNKKLKKSINDTAKKLQEIMHHDNHQDDDIGLKNRYEERVRVLQEQKHHLRNKKNIAEKCSDYSIYMKLNMDRELDQINDRIKILNDSKSSFSRELNLLSSKNKKALTSMEEIMHKINMLNEMIGHNNLPQNHRIYYNQQLNKIEKTLKNLNKEIHENCETISHYQREMKCHSKFVDKLNDSYKKVEIEKNRLIDSNQTLKKIEEIKSDVAKAEIDAEELYHKIIECEQKKKNLTQKVKYLLENCLHKIKDIENNLKKSPRWNRKSLRQIKKIKKVANTLNKYINALESYNNLSWMDSHKQSIRYSKCLGYANDLLIKPEETEKKLHEEIKSMEEERNSFFSHKKNYKTYPDDDGDGDGDGDGDAPYYNIY